MKKLLLIGFAVFAATNLFAWQPSELNYVPMSSFTDVDTNRPMMFSSAPISVVGVTISSPAPNSFFSFFRSTSTTFKSDITTQVYVNTDFGSNFTPTFVELFNMQNSSYTYFNKSGNAKLIIWVHCLKQNVRENAPVVGFCPGLPVSGQLKAPMMRISD